MNAMTYEVSCGAVVFTRTDEGLRYVITQSTAGWYGFPKGHMESGETEQQTALREIREEVGLDVRLLDGFRLVEEHPLPQKPGVMKRVIYFAAEYADQPIRPQAEEVAQAKLMSFDEAMSVFQFENSRDILRAAKEWLSE
ncbi:MAG: NUDIX domain-containing protein [Clostridia bacterium]|nr:NUDIX domain-containing protein [Clostridia bacterium]